jgi:hypothetical protein
VDEEADLARLLAETLADDALWASMTSPDTRSRHGLARRAIRLYRRTWPIIAKRPDESPLTAALSVVREIAALAAHHSYPWTQEERVEFRLKKLQDPRKIVELWIRLYDLQVWAAGLGSPLDVKGGPVTDSDIPEDVWLDPAERVDDRDAARDVATVLDVYTGILATRDDPSIQSSLTSSEWRRGYCALVIHARRMLIYGQSHLPAEAQLALTANVLAADALFVATYEPDGELFPTEEYLQWLLNPEARDWLLTHDLDLPESLSN